MFFFLMDLSVRMRRKRHNGMWPTWLQNASTTASERQWVSLMCHIEQHTGRWYYSHWPYRMATARARYVPNIARNDRQGIETNASLAAQPCLFHTQHIKYSKSACWSILLVCRLVLVLEEGPIVRPYPPSMLSIYCTSCTNTATKMWWYLV